MSNATIDLPEYSGSRCVNEYCDKSSKQRILHVDEIERVYPVKDKFDWWPLPPQAEYVCTICGFVYTGVSDSWRDDQTYTSEQEHIPIEDWQWDAEFQFDQNVTESLKAFVRGAPENADTDMIARAAGRHVVGVDPEYARRTMEAMDDYEDAHITADQFM